MVFIDILAASRSLLCFCLVNSFDFNFDPATFIWSIVLSFSFKLACSILIFLTIFETLSIFCKQIDSSFAIFCWVFLRIFEYSAILVSLLLTIAWRFLMYIAESFCFAFLFLLASNISLIVVLFLFLISRISCQRLSSSLSWE